MTRARRPNLRRSRRSGFTLIEVLATLLLLGIVIPVVSEAITVALSTSSMVRHRSEAAALAESKMTDLVVTGEWQEGVLAGDFAPQSPDYRWEAGVDAWDLGDGTVQQLTVKVAWMRGSVEDYVMVNTLVYPSNTTSTTTGGGAAAP